MKILIFGDVYGRIGRNAFKKEFPKLKEKYGPDFSIVNIDNITSGRGPIEKHLLEIEKLGVDIMTGGNHVLDNIGKIENYLNGEKSILLRPANFYETEEYIIPGKGYKIIEKNGKKLLVIHLLGSIFMNIRTYNPFLKVKEILKEIETLGKKVDGIVIDFHKEVTSEGYAMAYLLDSRVSFVFGTHTHVQTNDELILPGGTGIISDVGMVGPLYSIIGADFESVKRRFLTGINKGKIGQNLQNDYLINGVFIEIGKDMKSQKIEKIKIIGKL